MNPWLSGIPGSRSHMAAPGPESGPLGVIYDVSLCFTSHPPTSSGFHFRFFGDSPSLSIPSCFVASAVPSVSRATHASQAGWASPETSLLLLPPPTPPSPSGVSASCTAPLVSASARCLQPHPCPQLCFRPLGVVAERGFHRSLHCVTGVSFP